MSGVRGDGEQVRDPLWIALLRGRHHRGIHEQALGLGRNLVVDLRLDHLATPHGREAVAVGRAKKLDHASEPA